MLTSWIECRENLHHGPYTLQPNNYNDFREKTILKLIAHKKKCLKITIVEMRVVVCMGDKRFVAQSVVYCGYTAQISDHIPCPACPIPMEDP